MHQQRRCYLGDNEQTKAPGLSPRRSSSETAAWEHGAQLTLGELNVWDVHTREVLLDTSRYVRRNSSRDISNQRPSHLSGNIFCFVGNKDQRCRHTTVTHTHTYSIIAGSHLRISLQFIISKRKGLHVSATLIISSPKPHEKHFFHATERHGNSCLTGNIPRTLLRTVVEERGTGSTLW